MARVEAGAVSRLPLEQPDTGAIVAARTNVGRGEAIALGLIVLVAAVARFASLAARGTWDADQGHDMLVLTALVRNGAIPLLGPPTSIGDFHHGALYYYLLAPAAWLGGGDPTVVVGEIALVGVLAVVATWWLARSVATAAMGSASAGTIAGLAAAALTAVSATAVEESTFIWNPNLIWLSSAVTWIAAWKAWESRRPRWWAVAAVGQAVTMQCHVLGSVMLVPLGVLFVADVVRRGGRPSAGDDRAKVLRSGLAGIAILALSYVPLLVHELQTNFAETEAALAFLRSGGTASPLDPISRVVFGLVRVLAWPLTGLVTDSLLPSVAAAVGVLTVLGWMLVRARRSGAVGGSDGLAGSRALSRSAAPWLAVALLVPIVLLSLAVSGLASVTPLPTDHYHAFLDPLVLVVVGVGIAALWARGAPGRALAGTCLVALVAWNVSHWPPPVATDGGWPAAEAAAQRLEQDAGGGPLALVGLPPFKTTEAYEFPLVRDGRAPVATADAHAVVVLCDDLFVPDCGGQAESRVMANEGGGRLVDRFAPAPRRTLSVYLLGGR